MEMGCVPDHFKNINFEPYYIKLKSLKSIRELKKSFDSCDVVFDITYGDNFSDIYSSYFVLKTSIVKLVAISSNTKFVLLPQTYGPFRNKLFLPIVRRILNKSAVVFSRDELSSEFIVKNSKVKPVTVTDLALSLPYEKNNKSLADGKFHIGLNVSGLLWKGGFSENNQFGLKVDYQKYITECIESFIDDGYVVHIIPHVFEKNEDDDGDLYVTKLLKSTYSQVETDDNIESVFEVKNYIASMDFFIGARMHATVDAFSSHVPTIPFAYSRKFKGLYNSVNYDYIVDGTELSTEDAIRKTMTILKNIQDVSLNVEYSNEIINKKNLLFMNELEKFMREI